MANLQNLDNRNWWIGGAAAFVGHAAVVAAVLATGFVAPRLTEEEPVVLVELPPMAASAQAVRSDEPQRVEQPQQTISTPPAPEPRVDAPEVRAPLPRRIVSVPAPRSLPDIRQPSAMPSIRPVVAAAPSTDTATEARDTADVGNDPKAKKQEADYYSMLSAHLNRKKRYPSDAKKARQQGVVTVRFTVHSDGSISQSSIRKSSGHDLLDQATLDLMQRVAPLPKFPRSMTKDSVTISLPIDYSLRTS